VLLSYIFYLQSMELHSLPGQLKTNRLELRLIEPQDASFLFDLRSDPQVNSHINRSAPASMAVIEDFISDRMKEQCDKEPARYWVIFLKIGQHPIGTICLWNYNQDQKSIELGYELLSPYQGVGYMMEASKAVVKAIIHLDTQVKRISAFTKPQNIASNKLLDRVGFEMRGYEGKFRVWSMDVRPEKSSLLN